MTKNILQVLRQWRDSQARIEGVETFRVFPNAVLDAIAGALPKDKEEMLTIKGIKEAKYGKYGVALLRIVHEYSSSSVIPAQAGIQDGKIWIPDQVGDDKSGNDVGEAFGNKRKGASEDGNQGSSIDYLVSDPLSVTQFLDGINLELSGFAARVKGEITSVSERERWIYFSLKDREGSMLSCLVSRYHYELSGVRFAEGDEIIVEGSPEIYKAMGKFSLKVSVIEPAGEGALKKAYDALKKKLEDEGLFAPEKKRELPKYPERIALITSKDGAAIDDFRMNLGAQGLKIDFYPTSVEGKRSVPEIMAAIRFFNKHPERYDLLVIVRGGGSLESLQAFNNEALTREVATSSIPTLLGIGHEKDVTLAAMVADVMVSTPTATARTIREPFDRARQVVGHAEVLLAERFGRGLSEARFALSRAEDAIGAVFPRLSERFLRAEQELMRAVDRVGFSLKQAALRFDESKRQIARGFDVVSDRLGQRLLRAEERLREYDPNRALRLGYSLVKSGGTLVRSIAHVHSGEMLDIRVGDGTIGAEVKSVSKS